MYSKYFIGIKTNEIINYYFFFIIILTNLSIDKIKYLLRFNVELIYCNFIIGNRFEKLNIFSIVHKNRMENPFNKLLTIKYNSVLYSI